MITLTLTFPDLDQLQAFLTRSAPAPLVVTATAPATPPATVTVAPEPSPEPQTVVTVATSTMPTAIIEPEPAQEPEPATEPEPSPEPEPDLDTVSRAITKLAHAGRREHVVAVLARFGVKRGVDLKTEDRRQFLVELGQ